MVGRREGVEHADKCADTEDLAARQRLGPWWPRANRSQGRRKWCCRVTRSSPPRRQRIKDDGDGWEAASAGS